MTALYKNEEVLGVTRSLLN